MRRVSPWECTKRKSPLLHVPQGAGGAGVSERRWAVACNSLFLLSALHIRNAASPVTHVWVDGLIMGGRQWRDEASCELPVGLEWSRWEQLFHALFSSLPPLVPQGITPDLCAGLEHSTPSSPSPSLCPTPKQAGQGWLYGCAGTRRRVTRRLGSMPLFSQWQKGGRGRVDERGSREGDETCHEIFILGNPV